VRAPFADDVAHYRRLLARYAHLELIEVRSAEALARRIPERAYVSLLAAEGRSYDSVAFSAFLQERRVAGGELAFVVGGPFGAPPLARVDHRLSLGPMTLPHQLAWVVLLAVLRLTTKPAVFAHPLRPDEAGEGGELYDHAIGPGGGTLRAAYRSRFISNNCSVFSSRFP